MYVAIGIHLVRFVHGSALGDFLLYKNSINTNKKQLHERTTPGEQNKTRNVYSKNERERAFEKYKTNIGKVGEGGRREGERGEMKGREGGAGGRGRREGRRKGSTQISKQARKKTKRKRKIGFWIEIYVEKKNPNILFHFE